MHFFSKGHAALQITALQILTDILTQHGSHLLESNPPLLKVYLKALKNGSKGPEVQAATTVAVCKLLLGRVIQDSDAANDLLKTLIVAYFDPSTQSNQGVRQTLSYFLPVYSYSRKENQDRIRSVAVDAFHALYNIHESLDDEDEDIEMVSLSVIGAHLVDWTDPRKCYVPGNSMSLADEGAKKAVNGDVHLDLASDILDRMNNATSKFTPSPYVLGVSNNYTEEEKKILAPLLGKVHVSAASSEDKIRALYGEVCIAVEDKLVLDATGRNALFKIHVSLGKIVNSLAQKQGPKSSLPGDRGSATLETEVGEANEDEDADERTVTTVQQDDADERTVMTVEQDDVDDDEQDEDTIGALVQEQLNEGREEGELSMLGETSVLATRPKRNQRPRDSLVEELLSDEDDL